MRERLRRINLQRQMLTLITSKPGCTLQELFEAYRESHRTWEIRYHLQWLVRHGVVALRPGPRAIHCYPTGKRLAA
ncbi:MAG: hypothetical protein ABFC89_07375 [Methanospirillum sp.]|jgi:hypothetical protein